VNKDVYIGGAVNESSVGLISFLYHATKFGWWQLLKCRAATRAI